MFGKFLGLDETVTIGTRQRAVVRRLQLTGVGAGMGGGGGREEG